MSTIRLRPRIVGDWWLVGPSPDLDPILEGPLVKKQRYSLKDQPEKDAPVDHHAFRDGEGRWHMWGCVRNTSVGRVLYHWEADDVTQSPWRSTGEVIRVDHAAGESLKPGDEIIQSPFFVEHDGLYYMFYGGGPREHGPDDWKGQGVYQICLMTSPDGKAWTRRRDSAGESKVFVGPGGDRDPCVIRIGPPGTSTTAATIRQTIWPRASSHGPRAIWSTGRNHDWYTTMRTSRWLPPL